MEENAAYIIILICLVAFIVFGIYRISNRERFIASLKPGDIVHYGKFRRRAVVQQVFPDKISVFDSEDLFICIVDNKDIHRF